MRCPASRRWPDITPCSSARPISPVSPKITTAAGAIGPAKVLVMGLGVAGLEAIATAHRLGAVVEGYDVRPETEEQAQSFGAKFVETGVDARGKGGYARELTAEEKTKVAAVLTQHIQAADLIITTAAIPGPGVAETHQQGAGRRHEGRRGDCRPLRGRWRQLRGHACRARRRRSARVTIVGAAERARRCSVRTPANSIRKINTTCSP